jgi:hypothetical protein
MAKMYECCWNNEYLAGSGVQSQPQTGFYALKVIKKIMHIHFLE